jgi:hypothetical protein
MSTPDILRPVQMNTLPDISQVVPISEEDKTCLQAVEEVLRKHGALSRFGIALLHTHFQLGEDEILLEECDTDNRTLICKPVKISELNEKTIQTIWAFDKSMEKACTKFCPTDQWGRHLGYKDHQ